MESARVLLKVIAFALFMWSCMFLSILTHELGHLLMYRIFSRGKDWRITIGIGRTIVKFKRFTLKVCPITGWFGCRYVVNASKFQHIVMLLGGALANVCVIILLCFLVQVIQFKELALGYTNLVATLEFLGCTNFILAVTAIIPMKIFNGYTSDGWKILKTVTRVKD